MKILLRLGLLVFIAGSLSSCASRSAGQKTVLTEAAYRYLKANSAPGIGEVTISVEEVDGHYARLGVNPVKPTTDPATLYMRQNAKTGAWEGLSIGTGWSPDDFDALKIPASIRD